MRLVQLWLARDGRVIGNGDTFGTKEQPQLRAHLREEPLLRVYLGTTSVGAGRGQVTLAVTKPRRTAPYYGTIGKCLGQYPNGEAWTLAIAHLRMANMEE